MQDQRWAALAAEIAYELAPPEPVLTHVAPTSRPDFIEDRTERGVRQLRNARLEIRPGMTGPFPINSYVRRVSDRPAMSARIGALARVLGYGVSKYNADQRLVVLQWSDDPYRCAYPGDYEHGGGQMHGGYYLDYPDLINGGFAAA